MSRFHGLADRCSHCKYPEAVPQIHDIVHAYWTVEAVDAYDEETGQHIESDGFVTADMNIAIDVSGEGEMDRWEGSSLGEAEVVCSECEHPWPRADNVSIGDFYR